MKNKKIKKNIFIIVLYTVVMITWCLIPPLVFIGGTLRETGEEITSYAMGLGYWVNFGFTKAFMTFCTVIILHQACVIALKLSDNVVKKPKSMKNK